MSKAIIQLQNDVLKVLEDKIPDFYLTGGTALSKYYFQHRQSNDLDFFTHQFSRKKVAEVAEIVGESLSLPVELIKEQTSDKFVKIMMYLVHGKDKIDLKIDFVEDYLPAQSPLRTIDGINVHSIEDIYMRKIYTVAGQVPQVDLIGRLESSGRNAPKDYYDLYMLSSVFRPLSDFAYDYCERITRELLVRWFRTYDRMNMKTGVLELKTFHKVDTREIEEHFRMEIDKLLKKEIEKL